MGCCTLRIGSESKIPNSLWKCWPALEAEHPSAWGQTQLSVSTTPQELCHFHSRPSMLWTDLCSDPTIHSWHGQHRLLLEPFGDGVNPLQSCNWQLSDPDFNPSVIRIQNKCNSQPRTAADQLWTVLLAPSFSSRNSDHPLPRQSRLSTLSFDLLRFIFTCKPTASEEHLLTHTYGWGAVWPQSSPRLLKTPNLVSWTRTQCPPAMPINWFHSLPAVVSMLGKADVFSLKLHFQLPAETVHLKSNKTQWNLPKPATTIVW